MQDDEILDARQVAVKLKLNYHTVIDKSNEGELPGFKVGKKWRYRSSDIEAYIQRKLKEQRKGVN